MSWRRALRATGPLSGAAFTWLLTKMLTEPQTTVDDAIDLARRIEDDWPGPYDVRWMSSFHSSYYSPRDVFVEMRLQELAGMITVPHDDDYVLAMVAAMGAIPGARLFLLRHDTRLREEVFWRIFEVEGGGEVSLANVDKFTRFEESATWHGVVLQLTDEGVLPRERVLTACLDALTRDFAAYTSGWYSRLFTSLRPTIDELSRLEASLLALLSSRVGPTVTVAVRSLWSLHKARRLDVDRLADFAAPAMSAGKANVALLVTMLRSGAGDQDATARADTIADALDHPHPDIRSAAEDALRQMGRLDLLPTSTPAAAASVAGPSPDGGLETPSVVYPWPESDIIERLGAVLAGNADGIEFELALAALATLTDRSLLAPLMKVARKRTEPPDWPRGGQTAAVLIARVMVRMHGDTYYGVTGSAKHRTVVACRADEVDRELARGIPAGVLLATPEDSSGGVSPATLVDRFIERDQAGRGVLPADLVAALLRVSAAGRAAALARVPSRPEVDANGAAADALRYALGGEMRAIEPFDWWIAAARARNPLGDDPLLIAAGHDCPGAGTRTSVTEEWEPTQAKDHWSGGSSMRLMVVGGPSSRIEPLRPTCAPTTKRRRYSFEWGNTGQIFGDFVCPADADVASLLGLQMLVSGLDSVTEFGQAEIIDGLARHRGEWGPLSASALVLALGQRPALTRIHAAELFAAAVPRRVSVTTVADAFVRHAPGCVLPRWATALADASSISPGARTAVADTLSEFLPRIPNNSRGVDKLLDVLIATTEGQALADAEPKLREWLETFRGSSRAAVNARALLARHR